MTGHLQVQSARAQPALTRRAGLVPSSRCSASRSAQSSSLSTPSSPSVNAPVSRRQRSSRLSTTSRRSDAPWRSRRHPARNHDSLGWAGARPASSPGNDSLQGALLCSLLANGFLAAELVSRTDGDATPVAVRMVTLTESAAALTTSPASSIPERAITTTQRQEQKQNRKLLGTKASVERKLLSVIVAAPARKLPARFVDRKTGLVKNNVQVACRRETRSFLCIVRLASDERKGGIHVRYRVTRKGKEVFRWYGYRRG